MNAELRLAHEARMFDGARVTLVTHSIAAGVCTLVYDVETERQAQRRVAEEAEGSAWSGILSVASKER